MGEFFLSKNVKPLNWQKQINKPNLFISKKPNLQTFQYASPKFNHKASEFLDAQNHPFRKEIEELVIAFIPSIDRKNKM